MIGRYAVPSTRVRVFSWGVDETLIAAHPSVSPRFGPGFSGYPCRRDRRTIGPQHCRGLPDSRDRVGLCLRCRRPARPLPSRLGGHRPDRESAQRAKDDYLDRIRDATSAIRDRVLILEHPLTPEETFEVMCASDVAVSIPAR